MDNVMLHCLVRVLCIVLPSLCRSAGNFILETLRLDILDVKMDYLVGMTVEYLSKSNQSGEGCGSSFSHQSPFGLGEFGRRGQPARRYREPHPPRLSSHGDRPSSTHSFQIPAHPHVTTIFETPHHSRPRHELFRRILPPRAPPQTPAVNRPRRLQLSRNSAPPSPLASVVSGTPRAYETSPSRSRRPAISIHRQ